MQGSHTSGYNKISLGVTFIGNFMNKLPTDVQQAAGMALFEKGIHVGALRSDYNVYGTCQLGNTKSPGSVFYEEIKKWDHWSN